MAETGVSISQRRVVDVRDPVTNRLLFRVLCDTWEVEIQQRGRKFLVDMRSILTGTRCVPVESPDITAYFEPKC